LFPPAKIILPTPGKSTIGPSLKKNLLPLMFRGTCSSIEMLKGYMDGKTLGTPVLDGLNSSLALSAVELWLEKS